MKIEDCRVQFFIDSGKVGGIAATSGAMPSAVVPVTEGYDYGVVEMVAGGDDAKANCTADDFEVDSADWCSYKCAQKYSVQRIDASMWCVQYHHPVVVLFWFSPSPIFDAFH